MRTTATCIGASVAVLLSAGACLAAPVPIVSDTANSTAGLGSFVGSIEYTHTAGNMGSLLISLTNTSNPANGGYLTAFAFNISSADAGARATLISGPANFSGIANVDAAPFGAFDWGASATGGQFLGGGNPSAGLAVGVTGVFRFLVIAADAATLTSEDFLLAGPTPVGFAARFRGFHNNGSDKVPATIEVPLPASAAMAGAGLLCLGLRRRRC